MAKKSPAEDKKGPFKSEYADDAEDLVQLKDDAWRPCSTRRQRLKGVRQFTNMLSTLTEEEAKELGRTEITNFGLTYREMSQNESMYTSMLVGTNSLVEIVVDTDNPEVDVKMGIRMSEAINTHAIHYKGRVVNLWKQCAGEITVAGGGPVVQKPKYGWLPELRLDMVFPRETPLEADQVTYAFDPHELSVDGLRKMLAALNGREGKKIQKKNIEVLLEALTEQIKEKMGPTSSQSSLERSRSVRDEDYWEGNTATLSAWYFYEVKCDEETGEQWVSATLFTDGQCCLGTEKLEFPDKSKAGAAQIISYEEKAWDSPTDWLHFVYTDSEIGGVKNMDTVRGVAELMCPAGIELAELLNLVLEGDKFRAKPFWTMTDDANPDEVQKWNETLSTFTPKGVIPVDMTGAGAQHLLTPFSILKGAASAIAATGMSNTDKGGELRVQALERQTNDAALISTRVSDAYNHLDCILETMVYRILTCKTKPGTAGHQDIMAVRAKLERYGIPYEQLAKREHGRFVYLKVKARRMAGAGSRETQQAHSKFLMDNLVNVPPGQRPFVLNTAIALQTGDPDLADKISPMAPTTINPQKLVAENEADVIERRAPLGQEIPINDWDIHQDHIPIHLRDMQALLATDEFDPWDKLMMLRFTGLAVHTSAHLQVLLSNPLTNPEAKPFMRDFQKLVQASQSIAQRVEEEEGADKSQLTAKEQADMELKWAKLQIEGTKVGLHVEDMKRLWESRESRERLLARKQYASEVQQDKRFKLDAVKTTADIVAKKKAANKPAASGKK